MTTWILLALAGFAAGIMNVLAGGGGFLTYPALLLTGLDPRAANITMTLGIYPMQVTTGFIGRKHASGTPVLSFRELLVTSVIGGIGGAVLLLLTPPAFFGALVPWLVLFATVMFALGSFRKPPTDLGAKHHLGKAGSFLTQTIISIYAGYYGGGVGFLTLAALTLAGMPLRAANPTKIILVGTMNTSAVLIFLFSHDIAWLQVAVLAVTSELGAHLVGMRLLKRVNERTLRIGIIMLGAALSVWLFWRAYL
jgi:uncharacterized membrane protein YfcA